MWLWLLIASAPGGFPAQSSGGQANPVKFTQVQASVGLTHSVLYGPFTFPGDPMAVPKTVMQRNMGNGAAVGDYDNDGDPDIYVLGQLGFANRLYRNDLVGGARVFTNVSAAAGVDDSGFGRTAQFVDLDGDGWKDLILLNDNIEGDGRPPSRIYRNNGDGTFTDQTPSGFNPAGLIKGGLCVGDYDSDGWLDIYVAQWLMELGEGTPAFAGQNHLFRNHTDGVFLFTDATAEAQLGTLQRDSFSCVFADFDNDGDSDLYVAVDHTSDAYYRNDGGTFTDETAAVGATHTGNDMGVGVVDFDNDGDLDVYSTNITDPSGIMGTTQFNILLVNQLSETGTMTFVDEAAARGVQDTYWGWGTEFVDVENDGDLDLYAVNGFDEFIIAFGSPIADTPEVLFINDGTAHFIRSSGTGADFVSDARAAIAFDYNLDGRQDLLVTSILDPLVLLENRSESGNWTSVRVIGPCFGNADAVGARISIGSGGVTQMREVLAGGSYLAGRPLEQHFGLGESAVIEDLSVTFPNGQTWNHPFPPMVNRRAAIIQGPMPADTRLLLSRDLHDVGLFQTCMGSKASDCLVLDESGNANGQVDAGDLPGFIDALNWSLPGCVNW